MSLRPQGLRQSVGIERTIDMMWSSTLLRRLAGITLIAVWVSSCKPPDNIGSPGTDHTWEAFAGQSEVRDWNETIELSVPDPPEDIRQSDFIELLVMDRSADERVWFPVGYGARLILLPEGADKWQELTNGMQYVGNEDTLEPRVASQSNWVALVTVAPELPPLERPAILRVLVMGRLVVDGSPTGVYVGGYADIDYRP